MAYNEVRESGCVVGVVAVNVVVAVEIPEWLHADWLPCFKAGPDLFFPDEYGRRCQRQIKKAREICKTCPMLDPCLEWAVARPNLEGIWAATTPMERRRIRTGAA
jgi:WhiB family redox-sensing transcriptional regulator